jgi:hypothetical protein
MNLSRVPGRTLVALVTLTIGVGALALIVGVTLAFRGGVAGTLLGRVGERPFGRPDLLRTGGARRGCSSRRSRWSCRWRASAGQRSSARWPASRPSKPSRMYPESREWHDARHPTDPLRVKVSTGVAVHVQAQDLADRCGEATAAVVALAGVDSANVRAGQARPRKTTRARDRASRSVSDTCPMCLPSLDRGMVVSLSTMMLLGRVSSVLDRASRWMRSSGIAVGSLVTGQMVTESVASNRGSSSFWVGQAMTGPALSLPTMR